jgi:hypothetical protein
MRTKLIATLGPAIVAFLFSACASSRPALLLAPVGPSSLSALPSSLQGTLLVFSAYKTGVPSPSLPENLRQHTDYQLRSADGKPLWQVANGTGYQGEDPLPVHLPPGNYQAVARANGYGLVTVPVVIAANRTTVLHLEGGFAGPDQGALNRANGVQLPDGEIVGWKATQ